MIIYGLKNCDSCRKARKELEAAGREVEFVDVRANPIDKAMFTELLAAFGEDKLLNKKSTTWRQLDDGERETPALELLLSHPTLMKRPLIVTDGQKYLGWTKQVQSELL